MEEAESAMTHLCDLVQQVLASNQEMSLRLRNLDDKTTDTATPTAAKVDDDASTTSSRTATPPLVNLPQGMQRNQFGFAFEEDLLASRVYRKTLFSDSGESLVTSAARTTASSILSALSLTDVSNISVLAVPIYAHEISNSRRYTFGDFDPEPLENWGQRPTTRSVAAIPKPNKWDGFASAVWRQRRKKISKPEISSKPEIHILGVSLYESIKFANVAISFTNVTGETYVYGYVPTFVGKIGVFLKEEGMFSTRPLPALEFAAATTLLSIQRVRLGVDNFYLATDVEDIFCVSGSALRLQKLEAAFNEPPLYGKRFDWSGYTVHDAAAILLRYLLRLPESIIPVEMYEAFQDPLKPHQGGPSTLPFCQESSISEYQKQITLLPPLSRQLLLYLLDLLAVFASKAEINKMTSARLAAVFQPTILSPVEAGDGFIEEEKSLRLSQDVLVFLLENQDSFLLGMS